MSAADASLDTDARKASYYSRLVEERKARKEATKLLEDEVQNRELLQAQLEKTEGLLNQAELKLVDQKAHYEAQIDAMKSNFSHQLLAVEARVRAQQRDMYEERDKRQQLLLTTTHKEQLHAMELKFNSQLIDRVNEIMAQEKAAFREQIGALNRTVDDLQKQLAALVSSACSLGSDFNRTCVDSAERAKRHLG